MASRYPQTRPRRRQTCAVFLAAFAAATALAVLVSGDADEAFVTPQVRGPLCGARQERLPGCRARGGAEAEDEDEVAVWKEAYELEVDRSDLLDAQLKTEMKKLGEVSKELLEEFEGCMVDLEPKPTAPMSKEASKWAETYQAIRRCNEQLELKLNEVRSKMQGQKDMLEATFGSQVVDTYGPIRHKGITFKDISFPRYGTENGSQIFFLELPMPLGLKLEEVMVQPEDTYTSRAVQVTEVIEAGSAAKDGRIKPGDFLRCITVPKRKINANDEEEGEAGGSIGGIATAFGAQAGELTKALLTIPESSSFPFERVLEDLAKNSEMDSYVGMVMERPL